MSSRTTRALPALGGYYSIPTVYTESMSRQGPASTHWTFHLPQAAGLSNIKTAVHPVVITVPHTGKKALFVNEFNTSHIVEFGPDSEEGEELLQHSSVPSTTTRTSTPITTSSTT